MQPASRAASRGLESRSQDRHKLDFRRVIMNSNLEAVQERRGASGWWPQPRFFGVMLAVECLITVSILAMYQSGRLGGLFWQSPHPLSLSSDHMKSFLSVSSSAKAVQEAHRRLLQDLDRGLSNSSLISSRNGIKAVLQHKPSQCSPPSSDTNFSVTVSKEFQRVEHLKCALERSSSRVGYLLNRKSRDHDKLGDGLPTKDISSLEEMDDSEYSEDKFASQVLDNSDWQDSYESEAWSQPGEYIMTLELGKPPRSLKGIVDTGSDLSWLQCRPCRRCYEQSDPIYQPTDSSTYNEVDCENKKCNDLATSFCNIFTDSCDYIYTYGDDSYTFGTLSTDTFTLRSKNGEAQEFDGITFGCARSSRGTFVHTRADGVVALGRGAISLASQLGKQIPDRFRYCLVSRTEPMSVRSPIYFGDAATLTGRGAQYTPMLLNKRHQAYYYVSMTGMSLGGKRLDIPREVFAIDSDGKGGTIVDSGTTVTNLRSAAYEPLLNAMAAAVEYPVTFSDTHFDLCFDIGDNSDPRFPKLVFHFDGVDLDLPLENYMLQAEDQTLCLAVDRSGDSLSVIGNVQQQNYNVVYDREKERIGFQLTKCTEED